MSSFAEIHKKYDSVKTRDKHKNKSPYTFMTYGYPLYFEPIRNNNLKILEIGVHLGGSLRAMKEYFPNANIVGVDINIQTEEEERIILVEGSQSDSDFLTTVNRDHGPFDIIIDDASHKFQDQVITFETLWPVLNAGGLYFIEDVIHTFNGWDTLHYLRSLVTKESFIDKPKDNTDMIRGICFYKGVVVLLKSDQC